MCFNLQETLLYVAIKFVVELMKSNGEDLLLLDAERGHRIGITVA
jgi:hypothetical protein